MDIRRENSFPATSIGRFQGRGFSSGANGLSVPSSLKKTPSRESLTAHPLLSPGLGTATTTADSVSETPKYVPYTPRQRPGAHPNALATTSSASVTAHHTSAPSIEAKTRLQAVNLKAVAQSAGLENSSLGWMILDRIVSYNGTGEHKEAWDQIWTLLSSGQATLLLPLEHAGSHDKSIGVEFIKDHLVLTDPKSSNIVTLTGLRGTMDSQAESMTLLSTISPESKIFSSIINPSTPASLSSLPSLPPPRTPADFPSYSLPTFLPSLPIPLPQPPSAKGPNPATFPPRPGATSITSPTRGPTGSLSKAASASASRLTNPFSGFFNRNATPPPMSSISSAAAASEPQLPLPSSSPAISSPLVSPPLTSEEAAMSPVSPVSAGAAVQQVEVRAYTINRRISRVQVAKGMLQAIRKSVDAGLRQPGVRPGSSESKSDESQAANKGVHVNCMDDALRYSLTSSIMDFAETASLLPFTSLADPSGAPSTSAGQKFKRRRIGSHSNHAKGGSSSDEGSEELVVTGGHLIAVEEMEDKVQGFLNDVEDGVRERLAAAAAVVSDEGEEEKPPVDVDENEVKDVLERVERTLCSTFYDKLLTPPSSSDALHDNALSSRIAALNMLELDVEHLGVDTQALTDRTALDDLTRECGRVLQRLSASYCPAEKAAALIDAHRVIVDGLSRLPPLRLKSEAESQQDVLARKAARERSKTREEEPREREMSQVSSSTPTTPAIAAKELVASPETESGGTVPDVSGVPGTGRDVHETVTGETMPSTPIEESSSEAVPSAASAEKSTSRDKDDSSSTAVSSDVLLPLLIFTVVKCNPPHLVSHLLFTQRLRFRNCTSGEEAFCLVNLMAVSDFLENVDLGGLGLDAGVVSTVDLDPIPIRSPNAHGLTPTESAADAAGLPASLKDRVEQQVDAIAGGANKVFTGVTGVVDSSFGMLRSLLPTNVGSNANISAPSTGEGPAGTPVHSPELGGLQKEAPWNALHIDPNGDVKDSRPGFGLLRRDTGFSLAGIAGVLPIPNRPKSSADANEEGRPMVTVSRPASMRSRTSTANREDFDSESGSSSGSVASEEESDGSSRESDDDGDELDIKSRASDARSIKSFESMMSGAKKKAKKGNQTGSSKVNSARKSLSDRLASVPGLGARKSSPSASRRSSMQVAPMPGPVPSSRPPSPPSALTRLQLTPPIQRFMDCTPDDLRLSEVGELLRDYRRLVGDLRSMGVFNEP